MSRALRGGRLAAGLGEVVVPRIQVILAVFFRDSPPERRGTGGEYKIALHKTAEGYSASVPGLPGCWSQGATEQEALEDIGDAIREYLAARDDLLRGATVREVEVAP